MINVTLKVLQKELKTALEGFSSEFENAEMKEQVVDCEKHGSYRQFYRKINLPMGRGIESKTRCPQCLKEKILKLEAEKAHQEQTERVHKISGLKMTSGIAKRFEQARFSNYQETEYNRKAKRFCEAYAAKWIDRKSVGGGLILCGKPGTGKNHLASAIAHHIIEQHQDEVLITTALRIIRKVKSTWDKNTSLTEDEVMNIYTDKDLLIIDEVGVQFGSESEKIILFEIINERYEQMKPTILISNLSEDELSRYVGERIIDRMREGKGAVINFDWESYRQ
ncbi:ATP-binding protein [Avibacterium paragallinarum]|uniref:ATP-binding protein n=1 Tax=Avibacterium paragallinarum TaxID=728 RepID=A0ABU7QJD0_AVIPA|nr:ATP-binding protein [Avibacterium paragallinarum]QZP14655.1 ATP-binding protein [Avibacterium paragallinarum]WAL56308.1 ATP-binding protein [Avibacterium paragallinarum]WAM58893.1 ATP-binding protein [Avibacterium paragallinarum]